MARHPRSDSADVGPDEAVAWCPRCHSEAKTCRSCRQRWARAWKLVRKDGHSVVETARLMRLSTRRVEQFIALEDDRRELLSYRLNWIPTDRLRAFIDREFERDPELTRAELAHRLDMAEIDMLRQFGYLKPKKCNGATGQRVTIKTASRTVIALGRAPHELDGC